ncbi:MAG: MBL fold metallo-hydrolase [Actinomycetota bacterium]|nr:MBL fold metallo-hydrolase [Actinomycetota bacterium]
MIEHRRREPAPGVFRLVLPLPFQGLERVNAYLLTDEAGCMLVDCGIFQLADEPAHGWDEIVAAMRACDAEPRDVKRLVVTHPHVDHYGMAARFVAETGAELVMHASSRGELDAYRDPAGAAERLGHLLEGFGVPEEELRELTAFEDWRAYVSDVVDPATKVEGGESLTCGGRSWEVVHTPGHSASHICLFSQNDGLLISGDHLLPTVTPHIDFAEGHGDADALGDYLDSLEKVAALEPSLVLPGHGRPFDEGAARAGVIASHHDRRLGSILQVIRWEPHTVSEITDEVFGPELFDFQRRLAIGEAIAHLVYLQRRGEVDQVTRDDGRRAYIKIRRHPGATA